MDLSICLSCTDIPIEIVFMAHHESHIVIFFICTPICILFITILLCLYYSFFSNLLKARSATMMLMKRLRSLIRLELTKALVFSDKINFNVDVCGRSDVTS